MLENIHNDHENIYAPNILDKYAHRPIIPVEMKDMCPADFATLSLHSSVFCFNKTHNDGQFQ